MGNPFGRSEIVPLTNKSGGSVAAGDFVYIDTANNDSFTTGTTGAYTKGIGIAQQTIASNAIGLVLVNGYASLVNVNASVTRGNFLKSHTVVKQGTDAGSSRASGTCGMFLTGGTTPDALIWQPDLGGGSGELVATSTIWDAAGDLAVGSGADTAARLAIGATNGMVLARVSGAVAWSLPPYIGAIVIGNSTALSSGAYASLAFNLTDILDPLGMHDPASNNTRILVPSGYSGFYRLTVRATWPSNGSANTDRRIAYRITGGSDIILDRDVDSVTSTSLFGTSIVDIPTSLVGGTDYIEVRQWTGVAGMTAADYNASLQYLGT